MTDFTEEYSPGMNIYYAYGNELTGTKELYELKISKVFPDALIAWEHKGCAHIIGTEDEDNIYTSLSVAQAFFKQMRIYSKYGQN